MNKLFAFLLSAALLWPPVADAQQVNVFPGPLVPETQQAFTVDPNSSVTAGNAVTLSSANAGTIGGAFAPLINFAGQASFSASTNAVAASAASNAMVAVSLSSTLGVAVYKDSANSNHMTAAALTISGTTVTAGTPVQLSASTTAGFVVIALNSTTFVVSYQDSTNTAKQTVVVGTISGTTITAGTPVNFSASVNSVLATTGIPAIIVPVSSTQFVIGISDSTNANKITIFSATVATTVPTFGSGVVVGTTTNRGFFISALDATHFVVNYSDSANTNLQTTICGLLTGTTVTFPSAAVAQAAGGSSAGQSITSTALSSSAFVIGWSSASGAFVAAGTVSGTTVTMGANAQLGAATGAFWQGYGNFYGGLLSLDATHIIATTTTGGVSQLWAASIATTTVTFGTPATIAAASQIVAMTSSFVIGAGSLLSEASISGTAVTSASRVAPAYISYVTPLSSTAVLAVEGGTLGSFAYIVTPTAFVASYGILGIAQTSAAAGARATVAVDGIASGFTGLTVGTQYYANGDGSLTSTSTGWLLGTAISATQILMKNTAISATNPVLYP